MAAHRNGRRQYWISRPQPGGRARPIRGERRVHVTVPNLDLADPADIEFARNICRLWQDGPQALVAVFVELACLHLLRTELERLLRRHIGGGK